MTLKAFPRRIREKYRIEERGHASAILSGDFPDELLDATIEMPKRVRAQGPRRRMEGALATL